jgi:Concanavalin A-like lectin/glucanases superfamily
MYWNGSRVAGPTTVSQNYSVVPTSRMEILRYSAATNFIDDLRVTVGVARYTGATITVPSLEFPGDEVNTAEETYTGKFLVETGGVDGTGHISFTRPTVGSILARSFDAVMNKIDRDSLDLYAYWDPTVIDKSIVNFHITQHNDRLHGYFSFRGFDELEYYNLFVQAYAYSDDLGINWFFQDEVPYYAADEKRNAPNYDYSQHPTIAVSPNGKVVVCLLDTFDEDVAGAANQYGVRTCLSPNNSYDWETNYLHEADAPSPVINAGCWVTNTETIYFVGCQFGDYYGTGTPQAPHLTVAKSTDRGATYTQVKLHDGADYVPAPYGFDYYAGWLPISSVRDSTGKIHVMCGVRNVGVTSTYLRYYRGTGEMTFAAGVNLQTNSVGNPLEIFYEPCMVIDSTDDMYVFWVENNAIDLENHGTVCMRKSTDGGSTWSTRKIIFESRGVHWTPQGSFSATIDADDNVFVNFVAQMPTHGGNPGSTGGIDPFYDDVIVLLHGNGTNASTTYTDSGPNNISFTVGGGSQLSTSQKVFGTASMSFDGSSWAYSTDNSITLGDELGWVISFRVRLNAIPGDRAYLIDLNQDAVASGGNIRPHIFVDSSGNVVFACTESSAETIISTSSSALSIDTWYHIVIYKQDETIYFAKDGAAFNTPVGDTRTYVGARISLGVEAIGGPTNGARGLNGYLDEVYIMRNHGTIHTIPFEVPAAEYSGNGTNNTWDSAVIDNTFMLNSTDGGVTWTALELDAYNSRLFAYNIRYPLNYSRSFQSFRVKDNTVIASTQGIQGVDMYMLRYGASIVEARTDSCAMFKFKLDQRHARTFAGKDVKANFTLSLEQEYSRRHPSASEEKLVGGFATTPTIRNTAVWPALPKYRSDIILNSLVTNELVQEKENYNYFETFDIVQAIPKDILDDDIWFCIYPSIDSAKGLTPGRKKIKRALDITGYTGSFASSPNDPDFFETVFTDYTSLLITAVSGVYTAASTNARPYSLILAEEGRWECNFLEFKINTMPNGNGHIGFLLNIGIYKTAATQYFYQLRIQSDGTINLYYMAVGEVYSLLQENMICSGYKVQVNDVVRILKRNDIFMLMVNGICKGLFIDASISNWDSSRTGNGVGAYIYYPSGAANPGKFVDLVIGEYTTNEYLAIDGLSITCA